VHGHRRYAVVRDRQDALRVLGGDAPGRLISGDHARDGRPVALLVSETASWQSVQRWTTLGLKPDLTLTPDSTDAQLQAALDTPGRLFLEIGDSQLLARLREQPQWTPDHVSVTATDPLAALGELWLAGLPVDWAQAHAEQPRRVPLPGYPFQRQPYLLEAGPTAQPSAPTADAAPTANTGLDTEQTVSKLFSQMLGMPNVDPEESFFDLGGDSLVAHELLGQLEQLLPVDLEIRTMYLAPSVRELTAQIEERMRDASAVPRG
uniref:phosphopantetheine-binding protein n=1 Tax=Streptomyces sp. ms184 TaxID=1827974 RepID=UPI00211D5940